LLLFRHAWILYPEGSMRVTKDTRARLADLVAQGVLSAEAAESALAETECTEDGASCMACGSAALLRDYICGSCSILKVRDERKFWERVRSGVETEPRGSRPCSASGCGARSRGVVPVRVDQAEVIRMIDGLETDLTLLSWKDARLRSIPEADAAMHDRERASVASDHLLTQQLLSFWTAKRQEETIGAPRVSAGEFPAGAVA
jgi:hypothetical protein